MNLKKMLFNSITISLPKNIVQFSLGVILFWFLVGTPDIYMALFSLFSFLVAYSSVYLYNDLVDCHEDGKDNEKTKWKLVAGGMVSRLQAKILTIVFAASGLSLSYMVNKWFFLIIMGMLSLNFLHSSPYTRFKNGIRKTAVNMTAIEFLKYSSGWFALTSNISLFPFWLILDFAVVYNISYILYKFRFRGRDMLSTNRRVIAALIVTGVFAYGISFLLYGFPLSMIFLVFFPTIILLAFMKTDIKMHRLRNMVFMEYMIIPITIVSFMILMNPAVYKANTDMAKEIDSYTGKITEKLPEGIKEPVQNISGEMEKYRTLEDVESNINRTINKTAESIKPLV